MLTGTKKLLIAGMVCLAVLSGCEKAAPADPSLGTYATQQRMSAIEYNTYLNKQVGVFTNQLMTRITIIQSLKSASYPAELDLAKTSRNEMQKAMDSVLTAYPAEGDDENRKALLEAMQIAIDDMDSYIADIDAGADTAKYKAVFQNDFNGLTQMAGLYNQ